MLRRRARARARSGRGYEHDAREYSSTLLVAVATPHATIVGQIGDGAIVVDDGLLRAATWPQQGEYANVTHFLVQDDAMDQLVTAEAGPAQRIAVFSDGLQNLALQYETKTPYEPFFTPFFDVSGDRVETRRRGRARAARLSRLAGRERAHRRRQVAGRGGAAMTSPVLLDASGRPISVGAKLGAGGEGTVYALSSLEVAKIYAAEPTAQRVAKLEALLRVASPDVRAIAAWPQQLLRERSGHVTGFTMPRIDGRVTIATVMNPGSRKRRFRRRPGAGSSTSAATSPSRWTPCTAPAWSSAT